MYNKVVKRFFDFMVALIAMPFLLLLFIPIAIAIKCEDGGPVFYCGKRIGRNGKPFKMIKFRSMKVNAPDIRLEDGSTYNAEDDPRVTKVGKFLRATSIDELPQFFNIFVGQMSLIGPRPDPVDWLDKYREDQKDFLKVRPGVTGYSQAYFRNSVDSQEKISNDNYYAHNISMWLDIKIFFKTIQTIVKRENVYIDQQRVDSAADENIELIGKKILIVGASILQVPAIQKAKEMGLEVAVADYNPNAVGISLADKYFNASTIDKEALLKVAQEYKPDGIATMATDMPMRAIAYVCEKTGLNGISQDCAFKCTDKVAMIKSFASNGVPSPMFWEISNIEQLVENKEKFIFPCIMKPSDNSGSRGVVLCHSFEELNQNYEYAHSSSRDGVVLIEEYMTGDEVSVETFVVDGVANVLQITDKLTTGAPHFVEMGHSQPTKLSKQAQESIKDVAQKAVTAVGLTNGPAHLEMMVKNDNARMIEMGARMGGDCITSHLVPLSTGIDMTKQTILCALGEKVELEPKLSKTSVIKFIKGEIGTLEKIDGIEQAEKVENVKEIGFFKHIGDKIEDIHSSADRVGYVVAQADSMADAENACSQAMKNIKIEVR